ncbi:hypothetical protein RDI58_001172 [Solanum bulbocastanum]|uniref:Transposase MuDR plant domain-containing protein n=1 Tax=Solanum bulbocastanum TaxID=147425 RepID=A0AAN8U914_SOLBU
MDLYVFNIEGARLQGEESLVDVDVIEESDATSEECESFHDSDYSLEGDEMIFDKIVDSTAEWIDDELMSLQGDSDDDNSKRFIVFNAKRDLEDPKFEFTLNMIFSSSKEFKWTVEVRAVMMKKDIKFKQLMSILEKVQGHISSREWENNMSHCQAYRRCFLKRARESEIELLLRRKMFLKYKPNSFS